MPLKLIVFVQAGCAECDRQRGIVEQVKRETRGVDFREIDLAAGADALQHYDVQEHPTLVLEREGHELRRWTGVTGKEELLAAIQEKQQGAQPRTIEVPTAPATPGGQSPREGFEHPPEHVSPPPVEREPPPGPPL